MFCPYCGKVLMYNGRRDDVPTYHDTYFCQEHGEWEFTFLKGDESLLHIAKGSSTGGK